MKNKILLLIGFAVNIAFVNAQTTTAFRKNYNQALFDLPGNIVEGLTANTYVMAGTNLSFLPLYGTVTQLNDTGGVTWSFRYSDASIGFQLNDIKKDVGANQYITCGGSESNAAVFMVLDAAGTVVISKKFNINEANSAWFNRVIKASDGGYVAVGYVTGYDPDGAGPEIDFNPINYNDANGDPQTEYIGSPLIVKLDASGNHVWHKVFRYYIGANVPANRIYNDASFVDVVEVSDGYVAVGSYDVNQHLSATNSDGDDATPTDAIILKTTIAGAITYHKQVDNPDSSPTQNSKYFGAINTTSTGAIIVGGSDNGKELIQKYVGAGGFSQTFSRLFTYPGLSSVVDVSQVYEVNAGTDLATMAMYIQPLGFTFSNSIHRVNSTATTNTWAKRYDFNLISILPRGNKTSDNGYVAMSMTAGGADYDYHVIKTDPTGDTPLTGCPPTAFSPTAAAGPTTASDPSFNVWSGTPGANALAISKIAISPTPSYVCTKTACVIPLEATTVTATPNTICAGESSSITASGPSSGVSYQVWTASSGGSNLGNAPLSVSPGSTTTYYIQTVSNSDGACVSATRIAVTVTVTPNVTPTFTAVPPICSGAALAALPTTSNNGITGTWSPAINNTATTLYTFTPTAGLCATTTTLSITVNPNVTPTFTAVAPICTGDALAPLPITSNNSITGTWSPALNNTTTTTYTFTPTAGQCATTTTLTITVNSTPTTPTFTAVAPICSGAALAALPTTSTNGVTGTWSPAINNTATTTYTFTPTAGQCATTTTLSITVTPNVTPTFTAVAPICSGAALSALPTTSTNGVTGTWSPAIDNTTTTTYTFTPTAGLCATTTTLSITVNPNVTPTFAAVTPICSGDALSPLPTASINGINGTWSPALDNTTTTTYTFTPTAGQCATTTTLSITVTPNVTPTFTAVSPICSGAALSALPTTSTNGVTGTWSPAIDNTTTTTYTFTPTAGLCATTTTMTITVTPNVTPTFAAVAAICSGAALAALPTTSTNGVTGTWSPAIDNTTTTTYTFTPTAGLCATTTTLSITVNSNVTPTFTGVAPICTGDALAALPTTSNNSITGTWSPAINNTTTTTYTFTPTAGQCATATTMTINVNSTPATPTFTAVSPICIGDTLAALPTTSNNSITGTWSPAINNTATTTYTFTPTVGQCATTTTMTITVNSTPTTPTFTAVSPICTGDALAALPTTSINGITGTWSPAINNTATTTYTFTPTVGQCATSTTMTITVNTSPSTPTFTAVSPICSGDALAALPTTSNNSITGTWSPAINNTTTTTYTFTPTVGQCATTTTLSITVNPNVTPTFTSVSPICSGAALSALPTTSTNGVTGTWSPAINNTATTTYTFTPTAGLCATTTTLTITVTAPTIPTFTAVAPICIGESLAALPTTSNNSVTGTWSPAIDTTSTTTYTFTPTVGQCATTTTLTITVSSPPVALISGSSSICFGQSVTLTASGGTNYIWNTGDTTTSITNSPNDTTDYWAVTSVGSCTDSAFFTVNVVPTPNVVVTPSPTATIIQGNSIELTATGATTYVWTPSTDLSCTNCPVTIASPDVTTTYCATTIVDGCPDTTCVLINVDIVCGELFVPTAFSPNSDGVNDCLSVYNNCIESMDFKVFSRWGEVVYQSIDVNDCWDGTFKGTALNTAVFVYRLDAVLLNGEEVKLKGNVSLIK